MKTCYFYILLLRLSDSKVQVVCVGTKSRYNFPEKFNRKVFNFELDIWRKPLKQPCDFIIEKKLYIFPKFALKERQVLIYGYIVIKYRGIFWSFYKYSIDSASSNKIELSQLYRKHEYYCIPINRYEGLLLIVWQYHV